MKKVITSISIIGFILLVSSCSSVNSLLPDGSPIPEQYDSYGYDITPEDIFFFSDCLLAADDVYNLYPSNRLLGVIGETDNEYYQFCYENKNSLSKNKSGIQLTSDEFGYIGPAGGYVFYDKGSYSDGWRFLEAAPTDMMNSSGSRLTYCWGDDESFGTKNAIGCGKPNTDIIAKKSDISHTGNAARACLDYSINGYDDWFLPSKEELNLMYVNLHKQGVGGFSNLYWSSSESNSEYGAWGQNFDTGVQNTASRAYNLYVRAIRAF